jgi:hypothetical protein
MKEKKLEVFLLRYAGFSTLLTQRRCEELGFLRLLVFHIGSLKEDAKELLFS